MDTAEFSIEETVPGTIYRPHAARPRRSWSGKAVVVDPLSDRARDTWISGDFAQIAAGFADGAEEFVRRLSLVRGESVLDAACGTGNLAIPAAQLGARVTGLDIAPNLLATARATSGAFGLNIRFEEGNVERMRFADGAFKTVMSMFGVMFAPRPRRTTRELFRVTAPGGRIALANWTSRGFVGKLLLAHHAVAQPARAGVPSVLKWGDEDTVRDRLEPHADRVRAIHMERREMALHFPHSCGGMVELFREAYGPSVRTFATLDAESRSALSSALRSFCARHNLATEGSVRVKAEYLEVLVEVR